MTHRFYEQAQRALKACGGLWELEDILSEISRGTMQSFVRENTWAVTQIHIFPRRKVLDLVFVVGEMKDLLPLEDEIVEFAKYVGCSLIVANGRRGWLKRRFDKEVLPHSKHWKTMTATFYREV